MTTLPFKVKAVYEYQSPHDDDLHFPNGQIITVTEDDEEDWYTGEYIDATGVKQEGIFPRNFVEKCEPTAPPRPARSARPRKEDLATSSEQVTEHVSVPIRDEISSQSQPEPEPLPESTRKSQPPSTQAPTTISSVSTIAPPKIQDTTAQSQAKPSMIVKTAPPSVSEKPSSFRDRIAAFNKPAAGGPPAPLKPNSLSSGGTMAGSFIKKPFVAPPPSREAYIPVVRSDTPLKVYRREEDPEIANQAAESQALAEKVGLVPATVNAEVDEDQPKPTSLKERIALLQRQQIEQANRHAEAAQKKDKPKKPVRKKEGSGGSTTTNATEEGGALQHELSQDRARPSLESAHDTERLPRIPLPARNPSTRALPVDLATDSNEADMSGAGDEIESVEDLSAGHDSYDRQARKFQTSIPSSHPAMPLAHETDAGHEESLADEEDSLTSNDAGSRGIAEVRDEVDEEEEDLEDEDDVDPEIRRKEELRQRMAKMSGGMGMHGMFGPTGGMGVPMALPAKKKVPVRQSEEETEERPTSRAPPVPMPGLSTINQQDVGQHLAVAKEAELSNPTIRGEAGPNEVKDIEDIQSAPSAPSAPSVPSARPAPPPVPSECKSYPLPVKNHKRPTNLTPIARPQTISMPLSPGPGSESDDERSIANTPKLSLYTNAIDSPIRELPSRPLASSSYIIDDHSSPVSPGVLTKRASYFSANGGSGPTSPTTPGSKRLSRMPPIPGAVITSDVTSIQARAPPPPPPTGPPPLLSRMSTGDDIVIEATGQASPGKSDEEADAYEGDYDTDIASAVPRREALRAHVRDEGQDTFPMLTSPPLSPLIGPPSPSVTSAMRVLPPPLPPSSQAPMPIRQSVDIPRAAPPPPPTKELKSENTISSIDFDPYDHSSGIFATPSRVPPSQDTMIYQAEEAVPTATPPRASLQHERATQLPRDQGPTVVSRARQSADIQRAPTTSRRSTDMTRMSMDTGFIARDVDLSPGTKWWATPNALPPYFQGRTDVLFEIEENTASKRGGISITTKDVYILFADYSQTQISIQYDPYNVADAQLAQRQLPPPKQLRQDQLEAAWERFGRLLGNTASSKKDTIVGDGTPSALVSKLLMDFPDALLPIGTRAYGAIVYSNLANASVVQNDEIRPGDIITLRNAKLQGKHGPMHAKYSTEVGSGSGHVAIVQEWDGTKKKVRAWEQGRENKKVKSESYKLDDLRSGEVKIWRIMSRDWVDWAGSN